jgi:hypothetical protein
VVSRALEPHRPGIPFLKQAKVARVQGAVVAGKKNMKTCLRIPQPRHGVHEACFISRVAAGNRRSLVLSVGDRYRDCVRVGAGIPVDLHVLYTGDMQPLPCLAATASVAQSSATHSHPANPGGWSPISFQFQDVVHADSQEAGFVTLDMSTPAYCFHGEEISHHLPSPRAVVFTMPNIRPNNGYDNPKPRINFGRGGHLHEDQTTTGDQSYHRPWKPQLSDHLHHKPPIFVE